MKFDPSFFSSAYTVICQIKFELLYQVGGTALVLLKLPVFQEIIVLSRLITIFAEVAHTTAFSSMGGCTASTRTSGGFLP